VLSKLDARQRDAEIRAQSPARAHGLMIDISNLRWYQTRESEPDYSR
jgi:hypothetical protein